MDPILQVIAISGSAIALSFGLARMILRQQESYLRQQMDLARELFSQLDRRLQRLEQVITELQDAIERIKYIGGRKGEARKS